MIYGFPRTVNAYFQRQIAYHRFIPMSCHAQESIPALKELIEERKQYIKRLYLAGYSKLTANNNLEFALNCRPCGLLLDHTYGKRYCKLRVCPFCRARCFDNLCDRIDKNMFIGSELRIMCNIYKPTISKPNYFTEAFTDLDKARFLTFWEECIADTKLFIKKIAKSNQGYVLQLQLLPIIEPSMGMYSGVWHIRRKLLLSTTTRFNFVENTYYKRITVAKKSILWALAFVVETPREWLYADPTALAVALDWLDKTKTIRTTGIFRAESNKATRSDECLITA